MSTDPDAEPVVASRRRHPAVRAAIWLTIGIFAWFAVGALVGAVDWAKVAEAFSHLSWWVLIPLLGALLLRQMMNAVPLTYSVRGLGLRRSMQNDLAANLVATFAPPPSDIVLRVTMFRSWGLDPVMGMTGVTLNSAKFSAVRCTAPVLGLALLAFRGVETRQWVVAVLSGLVAAAFRVALVLLLRSEALAARLGRTAGRAVGRFVRTVDPEAWSAAMVRIRHDASDSLRRGLLPSFESAIVAGTIIWRATTIGGTLLLGLVVAAWWRRARPAGPEAARGSAVDEGPVAG